MSKRKSTGSNAANKRVKAISPESGSEEQNEIWKRAQEMQEEFDQGSEGSESEGSGEARGIESIDGDEADEMQDEVLVVPFAESSKSAQDRLTMILNKSRPLHPFQASPALSSLQASLRHLKSLIESLPAVEPTSPLEAQKKLKKTAVPYPSALKSTLKDVNWKVAFEAPARINLVGLWPVGAALKSKETGFKMDLAVEMPRDLFQDKDIKDYRYFAKRAFYIVVIQSAIVKDPEVLRTFGEVTLNTTDDELRPYLQLKGKTHTLNIWPTCPADAFVATKLAPERNNIRLQDVATPTPLYNASLLADTLSFEDLELFDRCAARSTHFNDASRLVQLWTTSLGWTSQLVLYGLTYLLDAKDALATSALGLFGSTLEWLAREDWERPVGWKDALDSSYSKSLNKHDKVFMHPSGRLNLLAGVSEAELELMRVEANRALQVLRRNDPAGMDQLFPISSARRTPSEAHFDCSMTLSLSSEALQALIQRLSQDNPDVRARPLAALHQSLYATLRRALSNRVKALYISSPSTETHLGLIYHPDHATRLVDHGPSAIDEAACEAFKAFWGDKSELRRFKDGSIVEACVWEAPTVLSRFSIPEQMVGYILSHKFGVDASSSLKSSSSAFHELVQEPPGWRQRLYQAEPESKGFSSIMAAYEDLNNTLRAINDELPLSIKAIAPASDLLRYSSTFIPGSRKTRQYAHMPESTSHVDTADLVLTLEQSGKWPTDVQAIQKVKVAILVKLADLLKKQSHGTQCETAFDSEGSSSSDHVSLEVLTPTGFAFRLHIFHEPEIALLGSASFDKPSLTAALQSYRQSLVLRPKHHAAMVSLIHQYAALSGTIRLVKRWIASHLLRLHITTEHVELLCAHVFLRGDAPSSPVHGFTQVLHLLSTWTWHATPLLLPLFTASRREGSALDASSLGRRVEFPPDKATQIQTSFAATRQNDPAINKVAWFVTTEEDMTGRWWTSPSKMVAGRVQDLATAVLQAMRQGQDAKTLFTSPTDIYDFALRLKSSKVTRQHQSLHHPTPSSKSSSNSSCASAHSIPIDCDPSATFVREAQALLGDTAALFSDVYGGTTIYGLFNPLLSKPRPWTFTLDFPAKPASALADGDKTSKKGKKLLVELDREALLGNLVRLSRGLVVSVSTS